MSERGEITPEAMNEKMGVAPVEKAPEPKAIPGEGESGQEATPKVETPVEPQVPPSPKDGDGEPKPTDDKGKSGEPGDDGSDDGRNAKETTPKGVQKTIDKQVKKAKAAERRATFAEGKAKALEEQLEKANDKPLPELVVPKEDDFDDFDKYTDALADHKVAVRDRETAEKAKKLENVDTKPDAKPDADPLTPEQEEIREEMVDSLAESREKHDDFNAVAFGKDEQGRDTFPVTEFMMEGMESSDSKMEILYYLGKNAAEAVKIANLPPVKQVMAIGQLDKKLQSPTKTIKTPGAPPPIKPANGSGDSIAKDDMDSSTEDWIKKRNEETGVGRRGGK